MGAKYCRKSSLKGAVCIFIHNNIKFHVINLDSFCRDKDIEVCAIKLQPTNINTCVLTVYMEPSGNFDHFLNKLDTILKTLLHRNFENIICGDFNINYLTSNPNKKLLDSLLNSYNLTSIVDFPTRIQSKSLSAIDNIFIDYSRKDKHYICPFFNGLSDHDGQLLQFFNAYISILTNSTQTHRKFDEPSILEFKLNLSFESWDDIFEDNDVNVLFKPFLNTYLRLFYASLSLIFHRTNNNNSTL